MGASRLVCAHRPPDAPRNPSPSCSWCAPSSRPGQPRCEEPATARRPKHDVLTLFVAGPDSPPAGGYRVARSALAAGAKPRELSAIVVVLVLAAMSSHQSGTIRAAAGQLGVRQENRHGAGGREGARDGSAGTRALVSRRRRHVTGEAGGVAGERRGARPARPATAATLRCKEGVPAMILPKVRDPRFVTIRRGGTLTDSDHQLLALWAASCAEHVLDLFESAQPEDPRPRQAIEHARAWVRGEVKMTQARTAGGHAMAAARDLRGAARHAAYAAGQAGGRRARRRARARCGRLCDQGRTCCARRKARARAQGDSSAGGSVTSSRRRFASSYLTTSGCGTTSAGRCSTAERTRLGCSRGRLVVRRVAGTRCDPGAAREPLEASRHGLHELSAWSRTWSAPRRRETSGSPPGSGSPSCPGP